MPRTKISFFLAPVLLACAASYPAFADELTEIQKKGELVCGILGLTPGMSFLNEATRQPVGYEVDLCRALAESLKVEPVLKTLTVPARIPELQQGRVDILLAELAFTEERAKAVDYSNPYMVVRSTVMVHKDSGVTSFEDLSGKRVGTTKGSSGERQMREHVPAATIVSYDTTPQAFLAFMQGKVVGLATDESSLFSSRTAAGEQGNNMVVLTDTLEFETLGAGVRKGETRMLEHVNEVLADLEKSGKAESLFMQWMGPGTDIGYESRDFKIDGSFKIDGKK